MTSDAFETRRVYRIDPPDGEPIVAPRIDQLRSLINPVPDLATIASQWRYVNSFGRGTIFQNVSRVPPTNKRPTASSDPTASMLQTLRSLQEQDVVLLLSGGIDSRTVMALLHGAGVPFRTVTYGLPTMPDWQIASRVSMVDGVTWQGIDVRTLAKDDLWATMVETAMISEGTYSVAHAAVLPTLSRLFPESVVVDGAYGALLRGGFANQLLVRGRADLASKDAARVEKWLVVRNLNVFHPDIRSEMVAGSRALLQMALDDMPDFSASDSRDWIDEFFLRWYVPGFVSNPHRIYDRWMPSEMPFLAPQVVADVIGLTSRSRSHARLFRSWIEQFRPGLRTVPVVGKKGLVPWICAGDPWRTALYARLGPKHATPDSGQMELGVISLMGDHLVERAQEALSTSLVPFHVPLVQELTDNAVSGSNPIAAQEFFSWLTLALALRS